MTLFPRTQHSVPQRCSTQLGQRSLAAFCGVWFFHLATLLNIFCSCLSARLSALRPSGRHGHHGVQPPAVRGCEPRRLLEALPRPQGAPRHILKIFRATEHLAAPRVHFKIWSALPADPSATPLSPAAGPAQARLEEEFGHRAAAPHNRRRRAGVHRVTFARGCSDAIRREGAVGDGGAGAGGRCADRADWADWAVRGRTSEDLLVAVFVSFAPA